MRAGSDRLVGLRSELALDPSVAVLALRLDDPYAAALAGDVRLTALASAVLERPARAFGVTFMCKAPRVGPPARWHQDGGPWQARLGGAAAVTAWIALDDATTENGCLRVVPGSHTAGLRPMTPDAGGTPSMFGVGLEPGAVPATPAVEVPLGRGGLVLHHPLLVHGSGPNLSAGPRTAVAVRFRGA